MSNIQIKTNLGGFPSASVIDCGGTVLLVFSSWPNSSTATISYSEAADLAQMLMDVVSEHINKAEA